MMASEEREGFIFCKSLGGQGVGINLNLSVRRAAVVERGNRHRADRVGLECSQMTPRVVGGFGPADTEVPVVVATEVQVQTHLTGRDGVV